MALEQVRPDQRALAQVASDLGVLKINAATGAMMIDLRAEGLAERFNILSPSTTIMQANPNFTPSLSIVDINPDLNKGDVYPLETDYQGKPKPNSPYALTKVGIRKLATAAGITTLAPRIQPCGPQGRDVVITATITYRGPDGLRKEDSDSADWHYEEEYENVVANCPEAYSGKPLTEQQRADWIRKNWKRVRGFGWRITETKAMLRACRDVLVLPGKFWLADLQKPFLVPSVTFTPDPNDKETLHAILGIGQKAIAALYGPAAASVEEISRALEAGDDDEPPSHDPDTGEVFDMAIGQTIEEPAEEALAAQAATEPTKTATHGDRPTEDRQIPQGIHRGKMLSEVCRTNAQYARAHFETAKTALGPLTEEWLFFWHGPPDDFSDVTFPNDAEEPLVP
jgi:hypothetical protein